MVKLVNNCRKIISKMKFIDIGANLTDSMFQGIYGGSQKHEADLNHVLNRCWDIGMEKIILTVGTVNEANHALEIARKDERIYATMGCHPTRCGEFVEDPDEYFNRLCVEIEKNRSKIVAIGELGLDYDRLHFCEKDVQKKYFEKQLELSERYQLPLFLHCRNSHEDFLEIMKSNQGKIKNGGVVHSFDGTADEAHKLIDLGFYIGLNGCSLKTAENLETVKLIPNDRIMIETDAPWCGVRPSHAGFKFIKSKFPTVKKKDKWTKDSLIDGRNEPVHIIQVLEVIAGYKNEDPDKLAQQFFDNTNKLFFS